MNKRTLGRSGIEVSAMGLGCYPIGGPMYLDGKGVAYGEVSDDESVKALHTAFDMGVNFLDTADVYGCGHSEEVIARAVEGKRDQVVIATKYGHTFNRQTAEMTGQDYSPAYTRQACEASLTRLNTDYIDLYQLHVGKSMTPEEVAEIRETLESLVAEGKIRWYGWSTDDPENAAGLGEGEHCAAIQQLFNIFSGNVETLRICKEQNMASINRTCLAQGLLTGKFNKDTQFDKDDTRSRGFTGFFKDGKVDPEYLDKLETVRAILTSDGRSLVQGAIGWLWGKSEVTIPIPGFKSVKQIKENCAALEFGPLASEQMNEINTILHEN